GGGDAGGSIGLRRGIHAGGAVAGTRAITPGTAATSVVAATATTVTPLDLAAFAQSRREDSDSRDRSSERQDAKQQSSKSSDDKKPSQPKDLELTITLPINYTSNAILASTETVVNTKPDVHVTPDIALKWSHQYDWVKLSGSVGTNTDRYFQDHDADENTVFWAYKAYLTDGKQDLFVPYFSY